MKIAWTSCDIAHGLIKVKVRHGVTLNYISIYYNTNCQVYISALAKVRSYD